jgi:hypothetical protein
MERLTALLNEIKQITLTYISTQPEDNQHSIVENLEQLQNELKTVLEKKHPVRALLITLISSQYFEK